MAAVVYSISDMRDLLDALAELADRRRRREATYPFCCALLYTGLRGRDAFVAQEVYAAWRLIDAMTGSDCVVFAAIDARSARHALTAEEIVGLARALGIPLQALPCAAVFCDAVSARDVVYLPFSDYIAREPSGYDVNAFMAFFGGLADAMTASASEPEPTRLDTFARRVEDTMPALRPRSDETVTTKVTAGATVLQALVETAKLYLSGGSA